MRIVQMLPTLSYGDAIGNHVIALRSVLIENGYQTNIYAMNIDPRVPKGIAASAEQYKDDKNDIILYHFSTGSPLNKKILDMKAQIVMVYHNITPSLFFAEYNKVWSTRLDLAKAQLKNLKDRVSMCVVDSNYNGEDLRKLGFTVPIVKLPILIKFDDYEKEYNEKIYNTYRNDEYVNILSTGRIAPNKKIENLIASFDCYNKNINSKSRLILAGSYSSEDPYYQRLQKYVKELKANVLFTGHIPFADLLAYFRSADLYLCLSEHEGFCVPLVESMYFNIPIIAYDTSAIAETLGGSGLLLNDNDPKVVAEAINMVITDQELKKAILENERERLQYYDEERIKQEFVKILNDIKNRK